MSQAGRDVTDAELAVLEALWEMGPSSVRQLVERLYAGAGPSAPATVQKLLERLEAKSYVTRDRSFGTHRFAATVDRGALINTRLRSVAEELCQGSLASLFTHLVKTEILSQAERHALRKLVEEGDSPRKKTPRDRDKD
jgi:BlaI family penicillinase repressor